MVKKDEAIIEMRTNLNHSLTLARKIVSAYSQTSINISKHLKIFSGKQVLNPVEGNQAITSLIESNKPFMISRLGSSELAVWQNYQGVRAMETGNMFLRLRAQVEGDPLNWLPQTGLTFSNNAGFFPIDHEYMARYAIEIESWLKQADLIAIWYYRHENRLLKFCPATVKYVLPMGLEPYIHDQPWTQALFGKRVLVVHPFAKSITSQYLYRLQLFGNKPLLPDFELKVIQAEQTLGGKSNKFTDWFDALDTMRERIMLEDFDIAIIGAGAYGLPLAAYVKQIGKQAIHMGGSTQILFGIRGKRWDERPEVSKFYNKYWVHPLPEETPENAGAVENSCYW